MTSKTHEIWNFRFFNKIIDSMADGVFTMDAQGRITSWNPSMERISGYASKEALGETCRLLRLSRCFGKKCPADIVQCGILEHGGSEAKECMLRHKDGRMVHVIKNAGAVLDDRGRSIGVVETVTDMTELHAARRKAEEAALRLQEAYRMDRLVGKSHTMKEVFSAIGAAAASDATVLIQGDSGTGKELVAAAIHYNSHRAENPLVAVNCSALSESLLESELFGHVKGAFTGAMRDRAGRFEEADGGTVFLDEIGEMSPFIQVKLLRVLQERQIERVGESKRRDIDIRIIAATHRDLHALLEAGKFRQDLYYRLKVFPIALPPLCRRREDIPLLADHFVEKLNQKTGGRIRGMSQATLRVLMEYPWPGNVRELENVIEHAFVLCDRDLVEPRDLPVEMRPGHFSPWTGRHAPDGAARRRTDVKIDKARLLEILDETGWNKAEAARRIGASRTAVWKYMKKWGIPLRHRSSE